jgi:hypothetical protein
LNSTIFNFALKGNFIVPGREGFLLGSAVVGKLLREITTREMSIGVSHAVGFASAGSTRTSHATCGDGDFYKNVH